MKREGGERFMVRIRRFRCAGCRTLHNELPDCLLPYKHYQTEVISGVLEGIVTPNDQDSEDYPCVNTFRLWILWFAQNFLLIEGLLRKALLEVCGRKNMPPPDISLVGYLKEKNPLSWLERIVRTIYNTGGVLAALCRH